MSNNLRDLCWDVYIDREIQKDRAERVREDQIFFNKCLREVDGRDAYDFLVFKASKILGCSKGECAYAIVNYYFENQEHFDCSFVDWLRSDNGPIVKSNIQALFPEFATITNNKYEIAKMVEEYYGIEIDFDCDGYNFYSLEFNFKELNAKRVDLDKIKEQMKDLILKELNL